MAEAVEAFIERKRSEGHFYVNRALRLRSFARFLGKIDLREITTEKILTFLDLKKISRKTWRDKYAHLEGFLRYWHLCGEIQAVAMPPPRGPERQTFVPYVYSRHEVRALLAATKAIHQNANSTMTAETMRTVLIVLYATGITVGEASALRSEDVRLGDRIMFVRSHGISPSRTLPLGRDVHRMLAQYSKKRALGPWFFTRRGGVPINKEGVNAVFKKLLAHTGIVRRDASAAAPRLHDFRTTFAVHRISAWLRCGKNTNRLLPALAGYMGRRDLNATEAFLALTPDRFKKELDTLSPQRSGALGERSISLLSSL